MQLVQKTLSTDSRLYAFSRRDLMPLRPEALWLLERGAVRSLTWDELSNCGVITLGYWGSGDVIGQPLSHVQPYQIECLTDVEACCIPLHQWNYLSDAICQHVRQTQELLCIVRCEPISRRLLQILVWFAQKFGRQVELGQLIELRLTH